MIVNQIYSIERVDIQMTMTSDSERIFHVRNVPCSFPYCDVPTFFFSFLNKGFEPLFSFAKGVEEKKRLMKDFFFFFMTRYSAILTSKDYSRKGGVKLETLESKPKGSNQLHPFLILLFRNEFLFESFGRWIFIKRTRKRKLAQERGEREEEHDNLTETAMTLYAMIPKYDMNTTGTRHRHGRNTDFTCKM